MKVFLAGTYSRKWLLNTHSSKYVLESFYSFEKWQLNYIHEWSMFLLDSGAFTFMNSNGENIDFDAYLEKYIEFINANDIRYFFELDVDSVIGYEKVKILTKRLEEKTNRQCIPVWHKSRGIKEWERMVKEYNYVAIGGIVTKEIKQKEYPVFAELIRIAHKSGCKVHGLGFTNTKLLHKYHFDSVDSTSWLSASRFGQLQYFNGKHMESVKKPEGKKAVHYKKADEFIFGEWIKFQKYADKYL